MLRILRKINECLTKILKDEDNNQEFNEEDFEFNNNDFDFNDLSDENLKEVKKIELKLKNNLSNIDTELSKIEKNIKNTSNKDIKELLNEKKEKLENTKDKILQKINNIKEITQEETTKVVNNLKNINRENNKKLNQIKEKLTNENKLEKINELKQEIGKINLKNKKINNTIDKLQKIIGEENKREQEKQSKNIVEYHDTEVMTTEVKNSNNVEIELDKSEEYPNMYTEVKKKDNKLNLFLTKRTCNEDFGELTIKLYDLHNRFFLCFIDSNKIFNNEETSLEISLPDYVIVQLVYLITVLQNLNITSNSENSLSTISNICFTEIVTRNFPFMNKNNTIINVCFSIRKNSDNRTNIFAIIKQLDETIEYPIIFKNNVNIKSKKENPFIDLIYQYEFKKLDHQIKPNQNRTNLKKENEIDVSDLLTSETSPYMPNKLEQREQRKEHNADITTETSPEMPSELEQRKQQKQKQQKQKQKETNNTSETSPYMPSELEQRKQQREQQRKEQQRKEHNADITSETSPEMPSELEQKKQQREQEKREQQRKEQQRKEQQRKEHNADITTETSPEMPSELEQRKQQKKTNNTTETSPEMPSELEQKKQQRKEQQRKTSSEIPSESEQEKREQKQKQELRNALMKENVPSSSKGSVQLGGNNLVNLSFLKNI